MPRDSIGKLILMTLRKKLIPLIAALSLASMTSLQAGEPIPLRAGPLTMVFDADNVFLRYIRVGTHEVLRGINAPIRNQNWATIPPEVSNLRVDQRDDSFTVTFNVACKQADIDFRWIGSIVGSNRGEIEFTFDGEAHSTFRRNRIGFCVLHGPSVAGQPWLLETVDGKKSEGRFPKFISPHQPAKNLRAITHDVSPGLRARVEFEGEIFEMEDQRNWTDASFKTYCTPLEIPYPVEIPKKTKVSQKIRISLLGDIPDETTSSLDPAVLTISDRKSKLPLLGLQLSSEVEVPTDKQLKLLKALNLDHLLVDLPLSKESFVYDLRRATRQAKALGVSLEVVLGLGESPAFPTLIKEVKELHPPVSFWLVRGGDPRHFEMAREYLAPISGDARIGVTRVTNFVELNRARPKGNSVDAIGFAINPQIHSFDNASITETLPIHADTINTARQFSGDRPVIVGPITMAPQLLDGVDQPGGPPQGGPLPTYVDKRQVEPFTAAWTLGSIKYLADSAAHSATYFETIGWNGIMDADDVSSRPKAFPSRPGELFPVYYLLRDIGEFAGGGVWQVDSSNDRTAVGLAMYKSSRIRVLIGNLTREEQTVTLRGLGEKPVTIQMLGGKRTQATPELPISLPPYGIAKIDRVVD